MLRQVPIGSLQTQLNDAFQGQAFKSELFIPTPVYVYNWNIQGYKPEDDKKALHSYSFNRYKDQILTKYVLALTIDEWGYIAVDDKEKDGPFISITIQLINKENDEQLWGYNSRFQQSTGKEGHGVINLEDIEKIYKTLIEKAVKKFFNRLNKK
jgi:hypothetical protein